MEQVSTRQSLSIAILMEMLEEVSRATDPQAAVQSFSTRIWKVRPVDHYLGVSVRGLPDGQYKITRRFQRLGAAAAAAERRAAPDPWRDWDRLPTHTGGFIGDVISMPEPRLFHDIRLTNDPALGDSVADMGSCIAVPLFDSGKVLNWGFSFRRQPDGYTLDDLEQNLLTGNLFGSMTKNLVSYEQIRKLNDSLRQQFEEVARVQQALLPAQKPPIPGLSIATSYLTSEQAGGDYYDFFELPGGRWGILVADVSGHGPGAATVMAMLHAILHTYDRLQDGPAAAFRFANQRLLAAQMERSFVTAFFGIYDPAKRELVYARAGHPMPRLKNTLTGAVSLLDGEASMPLGIVANYSIDEHRVTLEKGTTVVLYTDGITEAFNARRQMFGVEGLDEALAHCSGEPDCIVDTVHAALYQYTGSRTRDDDQTLVVFKLLTGDEAAK